MFLAASAIAVFMTGSKAIHAQPLGPVLKPPALFSQLSTSIALETTAEDNRQTTRDSTYPQTPQQRQFRLAVVVTIVFVILLFLTILLLSLGRMGRSLRDRMRLGRKSPPTECVDAWSQHRLDDDSE